MVAPSSREAVRPVARRRVMVIQSNAPSRSDALPLGPIRMPLSRKSWVLIVSWVGPFVWSRVRFPVRFVVEHFPADEPAQLRRATTACNMPMVGVVPVGRRVQVLWSGSRDG